MDPGHIAELIEVVANATSDELITLEINYMLRGTLWKIAHAQGCADEVERLLKEKLSQPDELQIPLDLG